jgi:two-component system KDP operon response regulator KdpE
MVANVKIAVVESDPLTRDFIVNVMMYSVNREILAFENGQGFKAYLEAGGTVNIALVDTQLPEAGSFELLKSTKKSHPDIVFVCMSANPADQSAAADLEADAFLAKPFALQDLFDIVQRFVVGE